MDDVLVGAGSVWPDQINLYVNLCWERGEFTMVFEIRGMGGH